MYGAENAGHIRYQIGNILLAQTEAIKLGLIDRYVDLCSQAITLCFSKLANTTEEKDKRAAELEAIYADELEAYSAAQRERDQDRLRPALYKACQRMMRHLLDDMTKVNHYAYNAEPPRDGRDMAMRAPETIPIEGEDATDFGLTTSAIDATDMRLGA